MKSILLATTATIAFAGIAAAEGHEPAITFSGEASLGYNTDDTQGGTLSAEDSHEGFYWELDIDVNGSTVLDNGLTAGFSFGFEVADDNLGQTAELADYVLFVESETGGLYFGDTDMAADSQWNSVGDMESDDFSETDGEVVLRGDISTGDITGAVSYIILDADGNEPTDGDDLAQLSLGVSGTFQAVDFSIAYQAEETALAAPGGDFDGDEVFGISVGTTFGGADVAFGYVENVTEGENSIGIEIAYPFGPVTATFYYVEESNGDPNIGLNVAYEDGPIAVELDYQDDQGTEIIDLFGSYDVGNGIMVYAGYLTEEGSADRFYVAGEYDLGGGASLLVSYAEDDDDVDEDEIGDPEYQRGLTIEAAFEF